MNTPFNPLLQDAVDINFTWLTIYTLMLAIKYHNILLIHVPRINILSQYILIPFHNQSNSEEISIKQAKLS